MTTNIVTFTIPGRPLSINKLYVNIPGQARRFISSEGKAFKKTVGLIAQIAMNEHHLNRILKEESRDVFVTIEYYFETLAGDIDNCNKAILDAMTGIVYEDDSQIAKLVCTKKKDKEKPRTIVTIRRVSDAE